MPYAIDRLDWATMLVRFISENYRRLVADDALTEMLQEVMWRVEQVG